MNDSAFNKLQEASWRRNLTDAEAAELRAWLAAHPEAQADFEADARLTAVLTRLPNAPVPSNFTARVLQAVERETAIARPSPSAWTNFWHSWLPKAAIAGFLMTAGLVTYHERALARQRELARSVEAVSQVASLPSPDILQDFEAIRSLNPTPPPDEEVLALMQ